jgi:hypothetical protein
MIHNLSISEEEGSIGKYISFSTEKPSNMGEYCKKWKIRRKDNTEMYYEELLSLQIAYIHTHPKLKPIDYEKALNELEIPCGIPLMVTILGRDYCQIEIGLLSPQSIIVESSDDMPF